MKLMIGNSLRRYAVIPTNFGRPQFRDAVVALKRSMERVNHLVVPSVEEQIACPKCHWKCAHRSRPKRGIDSLLGFFRLHPFRCRSCHRRCYRLSI